MTIIGNSLFNAGATVDTSKDGSAASFQAAIGTTYEINLSVNHTAGETVVTFPSSPTRGDAFAVVITGAIVPPGPFRVVSFTGTVSGTSVTAASGLSRTGQYVIFRYFDATVGWLIHTNKHDVNNTIANGNTNLVLGFDNTCDVDSTATAGNLCVGNNNSATGYPASILLGSNNTGSSQHSGILLGTGNNSTGGATVVVGIDCDALNTGVVNVGKDNTTSASSYKQVLFGNNQSGTGGYSVTMGLDNTNSAGNSVVVGAANTHQGLSGIAIGRNVSNNGSYTDSVGTNLTNNGTYSTNMGTDNNCGSGTRVITVGRNLSSTGNYACNVGIYNSSGSGNGNTTIGYNCDTATTAAEHCLMGRNNSTTGASGSNKMVLLGESNTISGNTGVTPLHSVLIGHSNTSTGGNGQAVAIGRTNDITGASTTNATAIGAFNDVTASNGNVCTLLGALNTIQGTGTGGRALCVGNDNIVTTSFAGYSSAIGNKNENSGGESYIAGNYVENTVDGVLELGNYTSLGARDGAMIRGDATGLIQFSIEDSATPPADGGVTFGSEAEGNLARGAFAIHKNGTAVTLYYNNAGTIESLSLGTLV